MAMVQVTTRIGVIKAVSVSVYDTHGLFYRYAPEQSAQQIRPDGRWGTRLSPTTAARGKGVLTFERHRLKERSTTGTS